MRSGGAACEAVEHPFRMQKQPFCVRNVVVQGHANGELAFAHAHEQGVECMCCTHNVQWENMEGSGGEGCGRMTVLPTRRVPSESQWDSYSLVRAVWSVYYPT